MKIIAAIPARYAATRFPGKLMQLLAGKPVIVHTWENAKATGLFDEVLVITDNEDIFNEMQSRGALVEMSRKSHESGSDRIAEAISDMDLDVVVNIQGDEPLIDTESIQKLTAVFLKDKNQEVQVASLMQFITEEVDITNPNIVKVVTGLNGDAIYFSRSPIPFHRDMDLEAIYYRHIGVYAYRKQMLLQFTKWPQTTLEKLEKLEQLRLVENGIPIRMVEVNSRGIGIDTPEDLEKARRLFGE